MIWIAVIAVFYGLAAQMVLRRLTNAARVRRIANRMMACVLEFRLFLDEPGTVLRAQGILLTQNVLLLREFFLPCLLMGGLFVGIYAPVDGALGRGPLPIGARAVVTQRNAPGVVLETAGVRVPREHSEVWRVRVTGPNNLGHRLWVPWFLAISAVAAAAAQTRERMRRVVP